MTDHFDPDGLFDALREGTRRAPVAAAADVRRRGHQRQVRARILYATTAVVVLTGGAGAAFAAEQNNAGGNLDPSGQTPSATAPATTIAPAPSAAEPTPSVAATSAAPSPVQTTPSSTPVTTTVTAPATTPHDTTTLTTTPTTRPTTAAAREHLDITITTSPAGTKAFTYTITVTGLLRPLLDAVTQKVSSGDNMMQSEEIWLDGASVGGGDAGGVGCGKTLPLVPTSSTLTSSAPIVTTPGTHQLRIVALGCDLFSQTKTVTFTVG
ncbi:MAG: hypothetical protein QOJ83_280 [Frankiales bacterium]|nr:hypothetical protein [Frankiales bacterium]